MHTHKNKNRLFLVFFFFAKTTNFNKLVISYTLSITGPRGTTGKI